MTVTSDKIVKLTLSLAAVVFLTASMLVIESAMTLSGAADDLLVLNPGNDTVVTGTITDMDSDDMTLLVNGQEIDVDLDNLDDDNIDVQNFLVKGQSVTVQGDLDDDRLEAKRIITTANNAAETSIKANIIGHDVGDNNGY